MNPDVQSLIAELDETIGKTSAARHLQMLRRLTDLFLESAASCSSEHVAVFDDVMGRLVPKVESAALIELSGRLARAAQAPPNVTCSLAANDNIAVSGPILEQSEALPDEALASVAKSKGPRHLAAIANRPSLGETVADILVERGSPEVAHKVAANMGARFSELGYVKLINRAKSDRALAETIATRTDRPPELEPFLKLALGEKRP